MRLLYLLLVPNVLLAVQLSCYEGYFSPTDRDFDITPSNISNCVLIFRSGKVCNAARAMPDTAPLVKAEPSRFNRSGCGYPWEGEIWCYCSEELCNEPKAQWWLQALQAPTEDDETPSRKLTRECAIQYARTSSAAGSGTLFNRWILVYFFMIFLM